MRSAIALLVISALASPALGAPLAPRDENFVTAIGLHGDSISLGDLQLADIVREALDDLCNGNVCDTTRVSREWTTQANLGPRAETEHVAVTISAQGTFPSFRGDDGQTARDSLKAAMVETARHAGQWGWDPYTVHVPVQAGYVSTTMAEERWGWFVRSSPQLALTRSNDARGAEAGDLRLEYHLRLLNPRPDACNVISQVVSGVSGAIGLLPGAGPIMAFLGSIVAGGMANCAKRDGDGGLPYVENFTNNSYIQDLKARDMYLLEPASD